LTEKKEVVVVDEEEQEKVKSDRGDQVSFCRPDHAQARLVSIAKCQQPFQLISGSGFEY